MCIAPKATLDKIIASPVRPPRESPLRMNPRNASSSQMPGAIEKASSTSHHAAGGRVEEGIAQLQRGDGGGAVLTAGVAVAVAAGAVGVGGASGGALETLGAGVELVGGAQPAGCASNHSRMESIAVT